MNISWRVRLTRRSAARLLDRPEGCSHSLGRVLTAAAAAATGTELAGEDAIVAMFQTANVAPAARQPSMIRSAMAKLVAVKLLAAGAVAATGGGLALAAATGLLASPPGPAHSPAAAPTSPAGQHRWSGSTESPAAGRPGAPKTSSGPASTAAALPGLCQAYHAGATTSPGHSLQAPPFKALADAAGGIGNIATYCTTLLGPPASHPNGPPATQPNGASTGHPSGASTGHPSGASAGHPSGASAGHPSGASTGHPSGASTGHPSGASTGHPNGAPATHPGGAPTSNPSGASTGHPGGAPVNRPGRQ